MTDAYEDAHPEESVDLVGVGPMTLRTAVKLYVEASKIPGDREFIVEREAGKTPASFDAHDMAKLADLEQFQ